MMNRSMKASPSLSKAWMQWVLYAAGIYNITWGAVVSLYPQALLEWANLSGVTPLALLFFQCIGMTIAVFGAMYLVAAKDPIRYWPVVFAGLLGRLLGPVGFIVAASTGVLTWQSGITIITNDLIWIPFFAVILWTAWKQQFSRG